MVLFSCRLSFEEAAKGGKKTINLGQYGGDVEVNIPAGSSKHSPLSGLKQDLYLLLPLISMECWSFVISSPNDCPECLLNLFQKLF